MRGRERRKSGQERERCEDQDRKKKISEDGLHFGEGLEQAEQRRFGRPSWDPRMRWGRWSLVIYLVIFFVFMLSTQLP